MDALENWHLQGNVQPPFTKLFPCLGLLMFSPSVYDFFNVRTNQANLLDYKAPSKLINLINKPWFLMDYRNKTSIHE